MDHVGVKVTLVGPVLLSTLKGKGDCRQEEENRSFHRTVEGNCLIWVSLKRLLFWTLEKCFSKNEKNIGEFQKFMVLKTTYWYTKITCYVGQIRN